MRARAECANYVQCWEFLAAGASLEQTVKELEEMYGLYRAGAVKGDAALGMLDRIERLLDLDEGLGH